MTQAILAIHRTGRDAETLYCLTEGPHAGELFRRQAGRTDAPSGQWKLTGIVQPWGWGSRASYSLEALSAVPMDQHMHTARGDFWTYKNGNAKFTGRDFDHGSNRQWGSPTIRKVSRLPLASFIEGLAWDEMHGDGPHKGSAGATRLRRYLQANAA